MADEKSQQELTRWALKNERDLEITTGVRKHIPHTRLQDFHMTLGTVNQSNFPLHSAVEELKKSYPARNMAQDASYFQPTDLSQM